VCINNTTNEIVFNCAIPGRPIANWQNGEKSKRIIASKMKSIQVGSEKFLLKQ